jgi:hypothetical protein
MIEHALEDCLTRMHLKGATPEECLAQYPEYRDELAPLLLAALGLGALESVNPRPEFKAKTRTRLLAHMRSNPRPASNWRGSLAFRYAASLTLLFVALATTGTALAQNALPGDTLFGWKLASERLWHSLQGNQVEADIYLSGRRVTEIQAIKGLSNLEEIGVGAYSAILQQLSIDLADDPERTTSVEALLLEQRELLKDIIENSQADLPELDALFGIVVLPVNEIPAEPVEEGGDLETILPVLVTVIPPVKKDEGDSTGSDDDNADAVGSQQTEADSESTVAEEPGLLENILNGLLGGD